MSKIKVTPNINADLAFCSLQQGLIDVYKNARESNHYAISDSSPIKIGCNVDDYIGARRLVDEFIELNSLYRTRMYVEINPELVRYAWTVEVENLYYFNEGV
jgi:hypothetical protein